MEFNKKTFEKALKANKIVRYQQHFEAVVKSYLEIENQALRQPLVSGELNCEHDWLVDMYDHFGFPASRFCDKCSTREAI